jgi:hypothetical protein
LVPGWYYVRSLPLPCRYMYEARIASGLYLSGWFFDTRTSTILCLRVHTCRQLAKCGILSYYRHTITAFQIDEQVLYYVVFVNVMLYNCVGD